jgi:uncharacterized protein YbjT (DUF2867 family)
MTITVTGANSSVGLNLLSHLTNVEDSVVNAIVRSNHAAESLPSSPAVTPQIIPYEDVEQLTRAMEGASCVVHLAGVLIESKTSTYKKANVDTAAAIAEAARRSGLEHIVLVSVIGANPDSPNRYLRSKGDAERLVTGSGVPSTIIRTPILLGRDTAGAAGLMRAVRQEKVRLLDGGRYKMRPLDLDDLSRAILAAIKTRREGVSIYELVGPEVIRYRELVTRAANMVGRTPSIGTTPVWIAKAGAAIRSRTKGGGVSPTVIDVIIADETVEINADAELGIELTPLSATLEKILSEFDED